MKQLLLSARSFLTGSYWLYEINMCREYLGGLGDTEAEDWEEVVVDNPLAENPEFHYELREVRLPQRK